MRLEVEFLVSYCAPPPVVNDMSTRVQAHALFTALLATRAPLQSDEPPPGLPSTQPGRMRRLTESRQR